MIAVTAVLVLLIAGSAEADPRQLARSTSHQSTPANDHGRSHDRAAVRGAREYAQAASIEQASEIVGKVARRTLLPGQVIPLNAVRPPDLVRQGRPASAIYQADGLTITMQVLPMQPGMAGDYIAVQNSDSGVVIKGTVLPDGSISLSAP